jgi:ABC-type uncharacterized transport system substrate-binding protein
VIEAYKAIAAEIEARKSADALIMAEQGRWYTAIIRPLLAGCAVQHGPLLSVVTGCDSASYLQHHLIAPGVKRAAILRDAANTLGIGQFSAIQAVASPLGVEVNAINVRDAGEIERAVAAFARSPNGGLVVTTSANATIHHDLIIALAARHKLPAVYSDRFSVTGGGLISYASDFVDQYRRAAGYVDRIL